MEAFPDFTITAFPDTYAEDLVYLGTNSGRDGDKLAQTKLHAVAAAAGWFSGLCRGRAVYRM